MATTFAGHVDAMLTVPASTTISVTTNAGGPTSVTITAGSYFLLDFLEQLDDDLESQRSVSGGSWTVSASTGAGGTGLVTIAVSAGTFSISWTSTALRNLLGFTNNISSQSSSTAAIVPNGLWMPDCPLYIEGGHIDAAPIATDLMQSESPDGLIIGHVGNSKYQHDGIRWSAVTSNRIWDADETTFNESLEVFLQDTQWGLGHSWFSPSSKVRITAHTGELVGSAYVDGWYWKGISRMSDVVKRVSDGWDGLWAVSIGSMVSNG